MTGGLAAVLFAAALPAGLAHAGGYLTARFGATEGHVTSDHVSAAYFNPAGLAFGHGTHLTLEGAFGYRAASYDRDPAAIDNVLAPGDTGSGTPQADVAANSGEATLLNPVIIPFAGVASDLGVRGLGVALTLSVPFGGTAEWDQNSAYEGNATYPGAVDGPQRWANITGDIRSMYITAAGAYLFEKAHLSVGLGLNVILNSINTLRARTPAGSDDLIVQPSGALVEGRSLIEASSTTFSLGAGVMWEPMPALRVGLSYQSQPGFGTHRLTGTLENKFGSGPRSVVPIEFEQTLPDIVRVGVGYKLSAQLAVRAAFEVQRWSVLERHCVLDATVAGRSCDVNADGSLAPTATGVVVINPRHWKDSYDGTLAATYHVNDDLRLDGLFAFGTGAVTDRAFDASFIDMLKFYPTIGARYRLSEMVALAGHWTQVFYVTQDVPVEDPYVAPSKGPSQAGTYKQSVGLFQLEAEVTF